jgi:hypothetical protein
MDEAVVDGLDGDDERRGWITCTATRDASGLGVCWPHHDQLHSQIDDDDTVNIRDSPT